MDRIAFAVQLAADHDAEFRSTNEAFGDAFDDFVQSRRELGLTRMEVWVQPGAQGPLVIFVLEGNLEQYFAHVRTASGVDEWMRQNMQRWALSKEDAEAVYRYPQSEPAFVWAEGPKDLAS